MNVFVKMKSDSYVKGETGGEARSVSAGGGTDLAGETSGAGVSLTKKNSSRRDRERNEMFSTNELRKVILSRTATGKMFHRPSKRLERWGWAVLRLLRREWSV